MKDEGSLRNFTMTAIEVSVRVEALPAVPANRHAR